MKVYTITAANKVWRLDEANGDTIPRWCNNNTDYHIVEEYPANIKAMIAKEEAEASLKVNQKEAQAYLAATDYINDKYKEEVELFKTISAEDFLDKYSEIYNKRKECREVL
jgi:hypothetical protein